MISGQPGQINGESAVSHEGTQFVTPKTTSPKRQEIQNKARSASFHLLAELPNNSALRKNEDPQNMLADVLANSWGYDTEKPESGQNIEKAIKHSVAATTRGINYPGFSDGKYTTIPFNSSWHDTGESFGNYKLAIDNAITQFTVDGAFRPDLMSTYIISELMRIQVANIAPDVKQDIMNSFTNYTYLAHHAGFIRRNDIATINQQLQTIGGMFAIRSQSAPFYEEANRLSGTFIQTGISFGEKCGAAKPPNALGFGVERHLEQIKDSALNHIPKIEPL